MTPDDQLSLEGRLRTLLPEMYEVFDDEVQPRSMGSAGLKFGADGKVQWDQIWRSFCDLAMAGGPPHRGKLLEPPRSEDAQGEAYDAVTSEVCRGIGLVTGLCAEPAPTPGWVCLYCTSAAMAGWLMRAIVMENVTAVGSGLTLYLPAGPAFRVEKEIKNVITSVAKTCHYWQDHMSDAKHDEIAALLRSMDRERPLVTPSLQVSANGAALAKLAEDIAEAVFAATGMQAGGHGYTAWIGMECEDLAAAIWMMRALAVSNVLSRREGTVVFLPLNPEIDVTGDRTVQAVTEAHGLAQTYGMFSARTVTSPQ